ncbi:hypothetical protein GJ496_006162 [Pomphorhynchus laevis]|nr:hypothetical protein GJ496_006162 [Pomphorhynchus laevis]
MHLQSILQEFQPDIAHVSEFTPLCVFCATICKLFCQIPVVWSIHSDITLYIDCAFGTVPLCISRLIKLGFSFIYAVYTNFCADLRLTVSNHFLQKLMQIQEWTGSFVNKQVIEIWMTGVDTELFSPKYHTDIHKLIPVDVYKGLHTKEILLTVSRLSVEKNLKFLADLLHQSPDLFLIVVGDGHQRKIFESFFPLDRVMFTGYLTGERLSTMYASADYFISASESETFGQMYLEAMSSGTPLMAPATGQIGEFVVDGEFGWFWEPGNLQSALEVIKKHKSKMHASQLARKAALQYSWSNVVDQTLEYYRNTLLKTQLHSNYSEMYNRSKFQWLYYSVSNTISRYLTGIPLIILYHIMYGITLVLVYLFAYFPSVVPNK